MRDLCRTGVEIVVRDSEDCRHQGYKALQTQLKYIGFTETVGTFTGLHTFKADVLPTLGKEPQSLLSPIDTGSKGNFSWFQMKSHWIYKLHLRGAHEQL